MSCLDSADHHDVTSSADPCMLPEIIEAAYIAPCTPYKASTFVGGGSPTPHASWLHRAIFSQLDSLPAKLTGCACLARLWSTEARRASSDKRLRKDTNHSTQSMPYTKCAAKEGIMQNLCDCLREGLQVHHWSHKWLSTCNCCTYYLLPRHMLP